MRLVDGEQTERLIQKYVSVSLAKVQSKTQPGHVLRLVTYFKFLMVKQSLQIVLSCEQRRVLTECASFRRQSWTENAI